MKLGLENLLCNLLHEEAARKPIKPNLKAVMVLQILRGEGHEEVVEDELPKASAQLLAAAKDSPAKTHSPATSMSTSPPHVPYSKWPPQKNDPQAVYEV